MNGTATPAQPGAGSPPARPGARLVGARAPYLTVREVADWMAAQGRPWKIDRVRETLRIACALIRLPCEPYPSHRRQTSRRGWYTTQRLLRDQLGELWQELHLEAIERDDDG